MQATELLHREDMIIRHIGNVTGAVANSQGVINSLVQFDDPHHPATIIFLPAI